MNITIPNRLHLIIRRNLFYFTVRIFSRRAHWCKHA